VIILGAGPAGLAAGLALGRAGWDVQVYEQASQVGGLARTVERDGFRFDIGGHRWYTKRPGLNEFLVDLLGDELTWVDRTSRIYFDGKYVDYPLKVGNVLRRIGPLTSARAVGDFALAKAAGRFGGQPVVSMEDAYVAQFGRTLYELFFRDYSEKVWGKRCGELSGDWVAQRSKGLSLFGAVRDAMRSADQKPESLVERFMYPRLGYGRISERMAAEIERAGGAVHLGRRVTAVHHRGARITGVTVSSGAREERVEGDAVISSIPMTELVHALRPVAPAGPLAATEPLTFRDLITVHLMLDRPRVTADTWIYVHDPRVSFARLHEPRNWSPALAPTGRTSLVLELFCEHEDATWSLPDDALVELTVRDLEHPLGFLQAREVSSGFVVRSRDAYPRYSLDYRQATETIKGYLRGFDNLALVGRGGTFRYNNADHAIESGLLAARNLLGEAADLDGVNSEPEYLEEIPAPNGRLVHPAT
jgi:protoporphyrinogen oxidase